MSWSAPRNAVPLADAWGALDDPNAPAPGDGAIQETSTSSVLPDAHTLFIYSLSTGSFRNPLPEQGRLEADWPALDWEAYTDAPTNPVPASPSYPAGGRIQVLKVSGTAVTSPGSAFARFDLSVDRATGTGPAPPEATGVPSQYKDAIDLNVEVISGLASITSGGVVAYMEKSEGRFAILFKDPHVIRLPHAMGGRWLMVVARYRVPVSLLKLVAGRGPWWDDLARHHLRPDVSGLGQFANPQESSGDIVAFVAWDAEFTRGLRGPFLLVDSLAALFDHRAFRLWLGAPSATVATDPATGEQSLFVHYVVESHFDDPATGASVLDPSLTAAERALWCEAQDAAVGGAFSKRGRGIAGKRFSERVVKQRLAGDSLLTAYAPDESDWNHETALEGEFLGLVEVLVPHGRLGGIGYAVRAFESVFRARGRPPVKVDPAGLAIDDVLHLFFCARERDVSQDFIHPNPLVNGRNGHGVWHARAIPSGERLFRRDTGEVETSVYGKHFLIRAAVWESDHYAWPDLVVASDVTRAVPRVVQDPDAWMTSGGTVCLFAGAAGVEWRPGTEVGGFTAVSGWLDGPLLRVEGSRADVDWDWADAFRALPLTSPSPRLRHGLPGGPGAAGLP